MFRFLCGNVTGRMSLLYSEAVGLMEGRNRLSWRLRASITSHQISSLALRHQSQTSDRGLFDDDEMFRAGRLTGKASLARVSSSRLLQAQNTNGRTFRSEWSVLCRSCIQRSMSSSSSQTGSSMSCEIFCSESSLSISN